MGFEELLSGGNSHRDQAEVSALTHVEPPCSRHVFLGVADKPREIIGSNPVDPVLLERLAITVFLGHIQIADAERAEEPLVADGDEIVRT